MARNRLVGVSIAFAGVVLIIGIDALGGLGSAFAGELEVWLQPGPMPLPQSSGVASPASVSHNAGQPLVASTGQLTGATALIVPLAIVVEHPWALPLPGWETGAGVAEMSLLLGVKVLGERPDPRYFIGVALLATGLAVVDGRVMSVCPPGLRSGAHQERSS